MGDLLLPVGVRRMSSWAAHQRRSPKSTEPGTDFYCPIGTPVLAPADGTVYGYGTSITPATGRWIGIDLDNGQRFRCMHHQSLLRTKGRVRRGEVIAYSGASGYGKEDWSGDPNTGGAHTHATLWPTHASRYGYDKLGRPYTVDFMQHADLSGIAGGGEIDMPLTAADKKIIKDAVFEFMLETAGPPAGYAAWPFMQASVWGAPIRVQDVNGFPVNDADGQPLYYAASGFLASTNALAHAGLETIDVAEIVKQIQSAGIADAVAAELADRLKE